jgi:hypothetical protein
MAQRRGKNMILWCLIINNLFLFIGSSNEIEMSNEEIIRRMKVLSISQTTFLKVYHI